MSSFFPLDGSQIRAVAHRGASREYPENTAPALRAAAQARVKGIEFDVQISRDGVPILYHDRSLRKIGGGTFTRLHERDWSTLSKLDAGNWKGRRFASTPLLRLEDAPSLVPKRIHLLLEIKLRQKSPTDRIRTRVIDSICSALDLEATKRRLHFLCFDAEMLRICRKVAPEIPRVLNLDRIPKTDPDWDCYEAICIARDKLDARFSERCRERQKPIAVYTINTQRHAEQAVRLGARTLISDRADWIRTWCTEASSS